MKELQFNHRQLGVTLVVTMVFLFVLFLVGGAAVRTSLVEEKMTGHLRDKHIAFEAAEAALVAGEDWLDAQLEYPTATSAGTNHTWLLGSPGTGAWWRENDAAWRTANSVTASHYSAQAAAPRYIIEERSFVQSGEDLILGNGELKKGKYFYQVTSRGQGGSADTKVHLRSTFIKRFD